MRTVSANSQGSKAFHDIFPGYFLMFQGTSPSPSKILYGCSYAGLLLFVREGGWILIDSRGEGDLKNWKRWWKYGAEEGLLEDWGGAGTFSTWFFRGLSFLHLEIILLIAKLCYTFEEKLFFPATIIFLPSFQVV